MCSHIFLLACIPFSAVQNRSEFENGAQVQRLLKKHGLVESSKGRSGKGRRDGAKVAAKGGSDPFDAPAGVGGAVPEPDSTAVLLNLRSIQAAYGESGDRGLGMTIRPACLPVCQLMSVDIDVARVEI